MMCFSKLNKRLEIMLPQQISDGAGGKNMSWSPLASVWANIKPRHASETIKYDTLTSRATHTITMRYRDDLSADMKFQIAARQFEIISIINIDEANRWLEVLCVEEPL